MQFFENEQFHIYNRGNNKQVIFYRWSNYIFFLENVRKLIIPHCDIISYCLMPNHFHLQIAADKRTVKTIRIARQDRNILSEGFRILLSSYTQAINKQNQTTGSLFQQNTKCKALSLTENRYDHSCFHYIHLNPLKACLVKKMEDWEFSSFRDYCDLRKDSICNVELGIKLLKFRKDSFYEDAYQFNRFEEEKIF